MLLFYHGSCVKDGGPKEGELVYRIKYLQSENQMAIITLLPKTVTMRFKDDNTAVYIEGFFSTFQLRFINNARKNKSYTVLRILDKKYISETKIDSLSAGYERFSNLLISMNPEDTLSMAGLLCYEADIICQELSDSIISFYYTNDLDIKNPNSNTPFKDIDGVLTRFQTRVAGIDMVFELEEFNNIAIDINEFNPPADYKKVSTQEINDLLKSFQ